jgi:hypothetical protein
VDDQDEQAGGRQQREDRRLRVDPEAVSATIVVVARMKTQETIRTTRS